jgi:hypothetical protein
MKQKRWRIFLMLAMAVAILAASSIFHWHKWIDLPDHISVSAFPFERGQWNTPSNLVANLSGLIGFFLTGLVIYFIAPRMVRSIGYSPAGRGGVLRAGLLGILAALLMFFIVLSAAVGSGTFPFAVILIGVMILASLVGLVALELRVGAWLASLAGWQDASPTVHLLLAALVLYPLTILPSVGGLIMVVYILVGLGAVVLARVNAYYPWNRELENPVENKAEGN